MADIKVKCPKCDKVLKVSGLSDEMLQRPFPVTCPSCGVKFEILPKGSTPAPKPTPSSVPAGDPKTEYGTEYDTEVRQKIENQEETEIVRPDNSLRQGRLLDLRTRRIYQLAEGHNTVGRKAATSRASVQIDTTDGYMSREHIQIDVNNGSFLLMNARNLNDTYVNSQLIANGDVVVLQHGNVIKMGESSLRFEINN